MTDPILEKVYEEFKKHVQLRFHEDGRHFEYFCEFLFMICHRSVDNLKIFDTTINSTIPTLLTKRRVYRDTTQLNQTMA